MNADRALAHYLNRDKMEMSLPIDLFRSRVIRNLQLGQTRRNSPECQWIFQGVDVAAMLVSAIGWHHSVIINCTADRPLP